MTQKLMSAPEVAALLGIELDTLYRYARLGKIRGLKLGKLWRFTENDVDAFIQDRLAPIPASQSQVQLLPDALRRAAQRSDAGRIISGTRSASYSEIDLASDRLAAALAVHGVRPGDRVLLILANSAEFVSCAFGIWKAGAILVAEDSTIRPANFRHVLADARPTALIVDRNIAAQLEMSRDQLPPLVAVFVKDGAFALSGHGDLAVESLDEILESDACDPHTPAYVGRPDDIVSITYTSGSTGMPKGVMHTHESWLAGAEFTRDHAGLMATDKIVIPMPLHHAYAFRQVIAYMLAGASVLIADLYSAIKRLRDERPTAMLMVPAACNIAIDHFGLILRAAAPFLRYIEIGSAAMPAERLEQLQRLLPGTPIFLPYGLTEARVGFLQHNADGLLNRLARISPGLRVSVVNPDGHPVEPGQTGEIVLAGRGLMKGYWGRSSAEYERLQTLGFHTGDLGLLDLNGRVELLGRIDDMLKVGGRKVNPLEVEMALNRHPAVAESAVVGLTDADGILENALHAFVVLQKDSTLTPEELISHCRKHVEPYKVPTRVHFRSALPKSPVGKVLRRSLATESMNVSAAPMEERKVG